MPQIRLQESTGYAVGLILFILLVAFLRRLFISYQSGIPGPFLARITRLWLFREAYKGRFHLTNIALHRKYGPVVRIRPNEYSIDDPGVMRTIYGAGSQFRKSDWYSAFAAPAFEHINLFVQRDPKIHSALRRQISTFYSLSYLSRYESFIDHNTKILCDQLRRFARAGEVVNLGHWLQCYAFDVITEITYGRPFGFLEHGDDVESLIDTLEKLQHWGTRCGFFPLVHYIFATYFGPGVGSRIPEFTVKHIMERERSGKYNASGSTVDFLTLFLDLNSQKPDEFTMDIIVAACSQNIGAGSDTTGISLTAALCNLIRDNSAAEKILGEMKSCYPQKDRSEPFSFKEAQDLKYFQAAIKETLRLHPATGMPLARRVPKGGVTLANHYFQGGTVVGVNAWVAHRNERVFGKDVESFRPERWLEADAETASLMERYFIPFGAGARTCIGKNISLLEISKAVPALLRNFTFHLQDNWEQEFATTTCDWFVKPRSLPVLIKEIA